MPANRRSRKVRLVLTAVALMSAGASAPRRARAQACPPAATVRGSASIVPSVRAILRAHGVASEVDGCSQRRVQASLVSGAHAHRYRLHIEDAFGRASDRVVADAETAASLIESWLLPAAEADPTPSQSVSASPDRALDAVAAPARGAAADWRIAGALELTRGSDQSLWYGGQITACGRVAALCLGGRLHIDRDGGIQGPNPDRHRTNVELLALAALPWQARSFTLTPLLAVGVGWMHTESAAFALDLDDVPTDLGVRVEAGFSVAVALNAHLSLAGEVSASWGRSIATSAGEGADAFAADPPADYLRAGIACQYTP